MENGQLSVRVNVGMKNRTVGSHNMNECSSRSHTMLTVYITSEQQVSGIVVIQFLHDIMTDGQCLCRTISEIHTFQNTTRMCHNKDTVKSAVLKSRKTHFFRNI